MKEIAGLPTLTTQCYEDIKHDILEGILAPGEKLTIEKLKNKYAVGHTPLREALSRLIDSHLVEMVENKGFYVTTLSESKVRDIYRTFNQIETLAVKQSIELGDDAWEGSIVAALHQLSLIEKKKPK